MVPPCHDGAEVVKSKPDVARSRVFVAGAETTWGERISDALRSSGNLATSVDTADIVLVVIGPGPVDKQVGLTSAITRGLDQSKHLVPVLVNDAAMPMRDQLPTPIHEFAYRQALPLPNQEAIPGVIARAIASRREAPFGATAPVRPPVPSVFVCYRRNDSGYWADLLARALMTAITSGQVWFDTGSERAGADYRRQIDDALAACRQFVVVIGPGFLEPDGRGHRRIDDDDDLVRAEIRSALTAPKPIHVVLTGQAEMPRANELPSDIAGLSAVRSISSLSQDSDAAPLARQIAASSTIGEPARRFDLFRDRERSSASARVLADWRARKEALEGRAKSVVQELGTHGWTVTSERFDQHTFYELGHPDHPNQRFVIEAGAAEVLLQERAHSLRRAGLARWTTRAIFSVTPRSPDTLAVQQLPDRLVEAALDPDAYLHRIGRGRVSKRTRNKFMSEHQLLGNIESMGMGPPPDAVEEYQRTLRTSRASGGLRLLTLDFEAQISDSAVPAALAMHPHGPLAAVATDGGVFLIDASTGQRTQFERFRSYRSVAFSRTGRLGAGTETGKVDVWDSDGRPLVRGSTPYTLPAKARLARTYQARSLHTLSWSDDGERLAGAAADAVWVWRGSSFEAAGWEFPDDPRKNLKRGALFLPASNHLLVFGVFRYLWLLESSTMEATGSLQLEDAPSHMDHWIEGKETPPPSPSAFTSINAAAVAPTESLVACAGDAGQTALCDLTKMALITKLTWHQPVVGSMLSLSNAVQSVGFSPDGRWLASVGLDRRIVVGNTETWQATYTTRLEGLGINEMLAWGADSSSIATVNRGHLQVWRLPDS